MIRMEERLLQLERTLDEIIQLNETAPVVVEGKRDVAALRRLGLQGKVLTINGPGSLLSFCDRLAEEHPEAILLMDWDRTGGQIMRVLRDNLKGRVRTHHRLRKNLAIYAEVHDVESLPNYLVTLRGKVSAMTRTPDGSINPRHH
jgi:5S rRNA maturation endonuclease (ribonuclease M5)